MSDPEFLTLDEVLALHADQIRRYGGAAGLRDLALLQSSIAMPETSYAGEYLHGSVLEMAAAYLFHLARNHRRGGLPSRAQRSALSADRSHPARIAALATR